MSESTKKLGLTLESALCVVFYLIAPESPTLLSSEGMQARWDETNRNEGGTNRIAPPSSHETLFVIVPARERPRPGLRVDFEVVVVEVSRHPLQERADHSQLETHASYQAVAVRLRVGEAIFARLSNARANGGGERS